VPSGRASPSRSDPPDPGGVETLREFATALDLLRAGRSYAELRRKAPGLARSTVGDLLNAKGVPSRVTVVTFLTACDLDLGARQPWLTAWERVKTAHLRKPAGTVRARDEDPRRLGVHASIQVDPGADDLPVYVPRQVDVELHTALTAAAARGGFVLVKGSSSVGKSRSLFEAVRAVLPDWWLLHPADADAVLAFADAPTSRTVVWLDELQRYLNQPGGIPSGALRALLSAGLVVAGTLWPDEYAVRAAPRIPGRADPYAEDRELLGLARIIEIPETFSPGELRRAEQLADTDPRIRVALQTANARLAQVLAAGPELVRWWQNADSSSPPQCYGNAIITAALDARRVGAQAPLTAKYLQAAAPGYMSSAVQATAPGDWFAQAIAYASTRLRGATACLTPTAAGIGRTAGWKSADYLHQHALQTRRTHPLPAVAWRALVDHHHPDDARRLGRSAELRGQPGAAADFYRRAAGDGSDGAAMDLAYLLKKQGRQDEAIPVLQRHAKVGSRSAALQLAHLLAKRGQATEAITAILPYADAGDVMALMDLNAQLLEEGRLDELRRRADAWDPFAARHVADLLVFEGRPDEAVALLRRYADGGSVGNYDVDTMLAAEFADLLAFLGRVEELRERASDGDGYALRSLERLLVGRGEIGQAIAVLQQRADAGDATAATSLASLLAKHDGVDELRARAEDGDASAAEHLAHLLARQGKKAEAIAALRTSIGGSDADTDDHRLSLLAFWEGRIEDLRQYALRRGSAGALLATLLAERDAYDELRQRADAGDIDAARVLVDLLADQGRVDALEAEVNAGTPHAFDRLRQLRLG